MTTSDPARRDGAAGACRTAVQPGSALPGQTVSRGNRRPNRGGDLQKMPSGFVLDLDDPGVGIEFNSRARRSSIACSATGCGGDAREDALLRPRLSS